MSAKRELRVLAVAGLPEFEEGDRVGEAIASRAELQEGDVLVISQKAVSKAEGRVRALASVIPGAEARRLAALLGKEPALVELILEESAEGVGTAVHLYFPRIAEPSAASAEKSAAAAE